MKKTTINMNGILDVENAKKVSQALNDLSGVVAADVSLAENKAYAYAGDRLSHEAIAGAIQNVGFQGTIANDEFLSDVKQFSDSINK